MRSDLNIFWVDDTRSFYEEVEKILKIYADDLGITIKFTYQQDATVLLDSLRKETDGFKLYDIYFVDYALSNGVVGDSLIKILRDNDIDSDILFYSSEKEEEIRKSVIDDLNLFQGVFIANRDNFEEKSNLLIRKNAKKLLSLNYIRGILMDHTSENDYTVKSYILRNFEKLNEEQKEVITKILIEKLKERLKEAEELSSKISKIENEGINSIKRIMQYSNTDFPLKTKYQIFEKMVEFLDPQTTQEILISRYFHDIIGVRNKLAHKKLEICKTQKFILYYDTIDQKQDRVCPEDCSEHDDENKISLEYWGKIRKEMIKFGKYFDDVQLNLEI